LSTPLLSQRVFPPFFREWEKYKHKKGTTFVLSCSGSLCCGLWRQTLFWYFVLYTLSYLAYHNLHQLLITCVYFCRLMKMHLSIPCFKRKLIISWKFLITEHTIDYRLLLVHIRYLGILYFTISADLHWRQSPYMIYLLVMCLR
jgi:hypothetical protein